jgi:hypothetical protein
MFSIQYCFPIQQPNSCDKSGNQADLTFTLIENHIYVHPLPVTLGINYKEE